MMKNMQSEEEKERKKEKRKDITKLVSKLAQHPWMATAFSRCTATDSL